MVGPGRGLSSQNAAPGATPGGRGRPGVLPDPGIRSVSSPSFQEGLNAQDPRPQAARAWHLIVLHRPAHKGVYQRLLRKHDAMALG